MIAVFRYLKGHHKKEGGEKCVLPCHRRQNEAMCLIYSKTDLEQNLRKSCLTGQWNKLLTEMVQSPSQGALEKRLNGHLSGLG